MAAGASSRLGRPKQLAVHRGGPLLRHVALQALASGADRVLVALGSQAERILPVLQGLDLLAARNPDWAEGTASSVRFCVRLAGEEDPPLNGLLFLACDQPAVTAGHLDKILSAARRQPGRIIASSYADTLGVPAFFGEERFPDLLRLRGDAGAKQLILRHLEETVAVPLPQGELDVDRLEDLRLLEADGKG